MQSTENGTNFYKLYLTVFKCTGDEKGMATAALSAVHFVLLGDLYNLLPHSTDFLPQWNVGILSSLRGLISVKNSAGNKIKYKS